MVSNNSTKLDPCGHWSLPISLQSLSSISRAEMNFPFCLQTNICTRMLLLATLQAQTCDSELMKKVCGIEPHKTQGITAICSVKTGHCSDLQLHEHNPLSLQLYRPTCNATLSMWILLAHIVGGMCFQWRISTVLWPHNFKKACRYSHFTVVEGHCSDLQLHAHVPLLKQK